MQSTNLPTGARRVLAGFYAAVFAASFVMLIRSVQIGPVIASFCVIDICGFLICVWYAFVGHRPEHRHRIRYATIGAVVLGVIGFAVGFLGPAVFAPESMPGDIRPFVYPFFTVPVGVSVGAVSVYCLPGKVLGSLVRMIRGSDMTPPPE